MDENPSLKYLALMPNCTTPIQAHPVSQTGQMKPIRDVKVKRKRPLNDTRWINLTVNCRSIWTRTGSWTWSFPMPPLFKTVSTANVWGRSFPCLWLGQCQANPPSRNSAHTWKLHTCYFLNIFFYTNFFWGESLDRICCLCFCIDLTIGKYDLMSVKVQEVMNQLGVPRMFGDRRQLLAIAQEVQHGTFAHIGLAKESKLRFPRIFGRTLTSKLRSRLVGRTKIYRYHPVVTPSNCRRTISELLRFLGNLVDGSNPNIPGYVESLMFLKFVFNSFFLKDLFPMSRNFYPLCLGNHLFKNRKNQSWQLLITWTVGLLHPTLECGEKKMWGHGLKSSKHLYNYIKKSSKIMKICKMVKMYLIFLQLTSELVHFIQTNRIAIGKASINLWPDVRVVDSDCCQALHLKGFGAGHWGVMRNVRLPKSQPSSNRRDLANRIFLHYKSIIILKTYPDMGKFSNWGLPKQWLCYRKANKRTNSGWFLLPSGHLSVSSCGDSSHRSQAAWTVSEWQVL